MKILVLNSGSSSLKYQLIDMDTEKVLAKGNFERIGQYNSFLTHKVGDDKRSFEKPVSNHEKAITFVLRTLQNSVYGVIKSPDEIDAIGHRIVHGGEKFTKPVVVTEEVIKGIEECIELAPLHNPAAILGIRACMAVMPGKTNVVVFDTSFHQTMPPETYIYPIPYKYYEKYKIRRYGFHGTSHQYVSARAAEMLGKDIKDLKIVSCHLGQGASVCAIDGGKSIDTSMGFTPLGGIPMGTRSGDLDPSVVTYIAKYRNHTVEEMDEILNKKSGVYGISEVSVDFRDIEAEAKEGDKNAQMALDNFAYCVAQYVAKYIVSMGGIDVLTFTAGVGEKGPISRRQICDYLKYFGVEIDYVKNEARNKEAIVSSNKSKVKILVIPTNEELMIARETKNLL